VKIRPKIAAWVGAVVLAGAVVATVLVLGLSGRPPASGSRVSAVPAADQAPVVAAALRRLATDPQSVVADQARPFVAGRAGQAVPSGSRVAPDERTWSPDGAGGGTMLLTITTPDGTARTYEAVMVTEAGQWKVLATFALDGPGVAPSPSR